MGRSRQGADHLEQRLRMGARVHDAQHLRLLGEARGHLRIAHLARQTLDPDALQLLIKPLRIRREFARVIDVEPDGSFLLVADGIVHLAQGGLGCRAQHDACGIVPRQLLQRRHAGPQQMDGQSLHFVQDDDAVGDVVQLAAARGAVRVQALEELHRRGHHDGNVPILRRALKFGDGGGRLVIGQALAARRLPIEAGMVFENIGVITQGRAEDGRGLIDDGCIGNDVDDAVQLVPNRMFQREGEGRQRLPAAGRDRQREQPGRQGGLLGRMAQNAGAQAIEFTGRRAGGKARHVGAQALQENR
nr:hypothetical protein [Aquabacter cavernae]